MDESLYGASPAGIIAAVGGGSEPAVIVVAHDPGLSDLARHWPRFPGDDGIPHMPTCAVAVFAFAIDDWAGLSDALPESWTYDIPRDAD